MDWNKSIKIGRNKVTLKELYFTMPSKYEKRSIYVDQKEKGIYIFTFIPQSMYISGANVIVNGTVNEKSFRVVHSKRMRFLFKINNKIILQGVIDKNSCFFPNSSDLRNGIVPIYSELPYTATNAIQENIINDLMLRNLFHKIHLPKNYNDIKEGLEGLYTIEVATVLYILNQHKYTREPLTIHNIDNCTLTPNEYQNNVIENIYKQIQINKTMNCMLYGDVGSGKTLVGFFIAMQFVNNGYSVAFLVPTSVLAHQVYEVFSQWTNDVELITGKTKKKIYNKKIFIGTHALLFRELPTIGLLIIDEQHKFGVHQRNYLFHKNKCDVLMMTATPIPRTFQMITKGLMHFEHLYSKPNNNVITLNANKEEVLQLALKESEKNIVFWIINDIEQVEIFADELKKITPNVYFVHSNIKNKNEILSNMQNGILISTTVVEVGIDLNVNTMIIENANKFGISQLHQLCGRVGRRGIPGKIIMINKPTEKLTEFIHTNSGWERSKLDHDHRGSGTLHNVLQSGTTEFAFGYTINDQGEIVKLDLNENILCTARSITIKSEYIDLFSISHSL